MPGPGKLVLVVGPSGAGKDSLLREAARMLAADRRIVFPRRVITRPVFGEAEAHDSMTVDEFLAALESGRFALSWQAHGLHYGIPCSIVDDLKDGRTIVVNVSRTIIADTAKRFLNLAVLQVTAPLAVIAERLAKRGRETAGDIAARLSRDVQPLPQGLDIRAITNDTTLAAAANAFSAALMQLSRENHAATV
jgi:ribose 1,5-bisphosphokinase